jgi:dTDP-4-amino-4,6-dideoxygalactose transaminase
MLRHSWVVDREFCLALSHNCRLDTIQAAILLKRLVRHPAIVERRRKIACRYDTELAGMVATPPRLPGYRDVFYTYTVRTSRRDDLHRHLTRLGIETRIQHPVLINDQPAFRGKVRGSSPRAASLVQEILCIPAHENLSDDDQSFVIEAFNKFFRGCA